jgi:molybdopterin-containing oxidoreductase family iron-sulfur binding subunit
MDRREFLKIAGWSALLGLGGKAAFELLAPGEVDASLQPAPLKAKKWGMAIDVTKLDEEVMDAAVKACHRYYNVPYMGNSKVELKWIWEDTYEHAFPDQENDYNAELYHGHNFLLLCNHCTNPPCCRACPTKATWKREDGIVMMDMHRCIGCRFCMAACPYGARSFNWGDPRLAPKELNPDFPTNPNFPTRSKGVVEKCLFCDERIAKGQMPACVEAANAVKPNVMFFGDLEEADSELRKALRTRYSMRRKPELGTGPNVYYIV